MAESSSSEESSEEEEPDEASASLRPVSSAGKKKPGLFTERGYLKSLSRQERRRIEREIRKGRPKPGEIVSRPAPSPYEAVYYCKM